MKTPREVLLNQHRHVEPKLDEIWSSVAAVCDRRGSREVGAHTRQRPTGQGGKAPLQALWRELIWPCRRVWTGLACAWALIIALNVASNEPKSQVVRKAEQPSPEEMQALLEQRRILAQLIDTWSGEPAERRESVPPGPRSERCSQILNA